MIQWWLDKTKILVVHKTDNVFVGETLINYGACKPFYKRSSAIHAKITIVSVAHKFLAIK